MVSSFLITLREGLEAALIVGLVLAAVRKAGARQMVRSVWYGAGAAVGLSLAAGLGFGLTVGSLPDDVGEAVEGATSLAAVGVLTLMIFWMRRQARYMVADIDAKVSAAAGLGSGWALGLLAFAAVLREGLETALFLFAALTSTGTAAGAGGAVLGLVGAVAVGYALYRGSIRLDLGKFFWATGALLLVLGAGLLAYGIHELQEFGLLPAVVEHVWDTNGILNEKVGWGALLKGLVGYNGDSSLVEVAAYWAYLLSVGFLFLRPTRGVSRTYATRGAGRVTGEESAER